MKENLSIVVADPQYLVREGFKKVIETEKSLKITGEITKSIDLWVKLQALKPDILVVDYDNNDFVDFEDLSKINEISPSTKTLVISNDSRKDIILKTVQTGVNGYLTKECGKEEIINALFTIGKGEKFFCNKVLDILLEKHTEPNNKDCDPTILSVRELEIIKLAAEGLTNKEIADKLFLSIHTVYTHRKNIMKKLKLKSPVELVLYALNSGIANGN